MINNNESHQDTITKKDLQAIRGALRTAFIRSDFKRAYLDSISIKEYRLKKSGAKYKRPTTYFICAMCSTKHLLKDCKVDHIKPIGQLFKFEHVGGFIERLWCSWSNLQGLCDDCHKEKTAYERSLIKGYAKL